MQETQILQGTVVAVVYQNYENGYAVLRLNCDDGQTVTAVGTIPLPCVGERLMITGKWGSHANYGRQFEAEFLERLMPKSAAEILTYLSSRVVKGIGPKTAARIVQHFGEHTLQIMEREPQRLAEVSGISLPKAIGIGEAFRLQMGMRNLMEFFTVHQLGAELAVKTYKRFGDATIDLLYDDPYLLMDEGLDASFAAVDRFAIELGISANDPKRIEAGVIFELRFNLEAGHTFLPTDKLTAATAQLLSLDPEDVQNCISRLEQNGQLILQTLCGISACYLPEMYEAETYCAQRLLSLADQVYPAPKALEKKLKLAEEKGHISYSTQQSQAILEAAQSGLLIITGGPGTGKTTLLNGVLNLFDQMELTCLLAAPTGRAAKRLTEVTGRDASTIHRLLEAGIDTHTGDLVFCRDESNPLKTHAVIIDEMSMIDVKLLHNLLLALPPRCRLILVGDPDQLPPVGPGFPFQDMLRSGVLPCVRLTEVFRQAQLSLIVMNAHRINGGEMPLLKEVKSDFFFLPVSSEDALAQTIVELCSTRLPKNMGIPADQIQVLSPTKRGSSGTIRLNGLLQARLNPGAPGKAEHHFGDIVFRVGDRVMQVRNNYDIVWKKQDGSAVGTGIFNGDVGTVIAIDNDMQTLSVLFDDKQADYDFTQLNELEPAYAMTVHKSQGSEYRAVVLSLWNGSPYLMNRSILYTAVTRAKELLVLVGREDVIAAMVENARVGRRYSGLKLRLQKKV